MFIQKHFTLHITVVVKYTQLWSVGTESPRSKKIISNDKHKFLRKKVDLKDTESPISKKLFLLTNISLEAEKKNQRKQLQNAGKQSKMGEKK